MPSFLGGAACGESYEVLLSMPSVLGGAAWGESYEVLLSMPSVLGGAAWVFICLSSVFFKWFY